MGYTVQKLLEDETGRHIGYQVCNADMISVAAFRGGANPAFYGALKLAIVECNRLNDM